MPKVATTKPNTGDQKKKKDQSDLCATLAKRQCNVTVHFSISGQNILIYDVSHFTFLISNNQTHLESKGCHTKNNKPDMSRIKWL